MKYNLTSIRRELTSCIQALADKKQEIAISWRCLNCRAIHSGNVLKKTQSIKHDYSIGGYKPDLALFDVNGDLVAAIHFLKRKSIDATLQEFYRDKCVYIQAKLEPGDDFDVLFQKLQKPDFATGCRNPKCKTCNNYMQKSILWIIEGACWKCEGDMKVAAIEAGMSRGGSYEGPEQFTPSEIKIARNKGVVIATHFSKTQGRSYLANTCPHCNAFVGDHYLFTEYISCAGYGGDDFEQIEVGYHCEHCSAPKFE